MDGWYLEFRYSTAKHPDVFLEASQFVDGGTFQALARKKAQAMWRKLKRTNNPAKTPRLIRPRLVWKEYSSFYAPKR